MAAPVQLISQSLLDETLARAEQSPRLRMNHNFHDGNDALCHRFLNAICRGSYCPPHRHITPPKPESFILLSGRLAFLLFEDSGTLTACHRLGENGLFGIDVAPGLYHSIVALSPQAVCFEVKPGPYAPMADKDFAPFAPREGTPEAPAYLTELERRIDQMR
jgi:cupin fold WbuC family metalloprotein